MKCTTVYKKEGQVCLLFQGISEVFANTLRRLVLEEVPTLAVEKIKVTANNSALYDEMLSLRLGLMPIKTDLSTYELKESVPEDQRESARCELKMTLKVDKKGMVYAEDVKSTDPNCTFVYPKTPLVRLLPKQKIDMEIIASLGKGKDHMKWASGHAYYKRVPKITVGKCDATKVAELNKDGLFTIKGDKVTINVEKSYESELVDFYAKNLEGVKVEQTDDLAFFLESWGQLTCTQILDQCAHILTQKIEALEGAL